MILFCRRNWFFNGIKDEDLLFEDNTEELRKSWRKYSYRFIQDEVQSIRKNRSPMFHSCKLKNQKHINSSTLSGTSDLHSTQHSIPFLSDLPSWDNIALWLGLTYTGVTSLPSWASSSKAPKPCLGVCMGSTAQAQLASEQCSQDLLAACSVLDLLNNLGGRSQTSLSI